MAKRDQDFLNIQIVQATNGFVITRNVFEPKNQGLCVPHGGNEVYVAKSADEASKLITQILKWQEIE